MHQYTTECAFSSIPIIELIEYFPLEKTLLELNIIYSIVIIQGGPKKTNPTTFFYSIAHNH